MKRILLLTCGTNACYHIARILKEKFRKDFYIIGVDINKEWELPIYNYIDKFYQSPYSNDPDYYSYILKICKEENVNYLLPSFDYDQSLFYNDNKDLLELGVYSFGVSKDVLEFYNNKNTTNQYLKSINIPTPQTYSLNEIQNNKEYFVKPQNGVGSIGAKKMSGESVLKDSQKNNYIIQEICNAPEITLECFNYNGQIYSIARERIASKAGVCIKARLFQEKNLHKIAETFSKSIKLPHIFNLQFMVNNEGHYVVTDVNLRTAGGMSMSYAVGWDEVSSLAQIMLGNLNKVTDTINMEIPETYVVRAYKDIVTKVSSNRIGFDLDGTLLDSRLRHSKVMDYVLNLVGLELDTSDLVEYKSNQYNNIDWLYSKGVSRELAEKINAIWVNNIEKEEFLVYDIIYPHTISTLQKFSETNNLYLITARNNIQGVLKQIRNLDIEKYFTEIHVVSSSHSSSEEKRNIIVSKGIKDFYGDTESDYKATINTDCKFHAVANGFRSLSFLEKLGTEIIKF